MPDRLASQIVMQVLETLAEHDVLITAGLDQDWIIRDLNNATDAAIEEVEKLLRQD